MNGGSTIHITNFQTGTVILETSDVYPGLLNDYRDLTKEVKVPVLFYYGTNDWPIGPEHYKGY